MDERAAEPYIPCRTLSLRVHEFVAIGCNCECMYAIDIALLCPFEQWILYPLK